MGRGVCALAGWRDRLGVVRGGQARWWQPWQLWWWRWRLCCVATRYHAISLLCLCSPTPLSPFSSLVPSAHCLFACRAKRTEEEDAAAGGGAAVPATRASFASLSGMVDQIVSFNLGHNAEVEAVDLLLETQTLERLLAPGVVDAAAYPRVCLYLLKCGGAWRRAVRCSAVPRSGARERVLLVVGWLVVHTQRCLPPTRPIPFLSPSLSSRSPADYLPSSEEAAAGFDVAFRLYVAHGQLPDALRVALRARGDAAAGRIATVFEVSARGWILAWRLRGGGGP